MSQPPTGNLSGKMLDEFQILEFIAKGSMGEVYRAFDTKLQVYRAVKVLAPHLAYDDEFVRRFEAEARHLAALEHPNIVRIYRVGVSNGFHYIAMQLVEGSTIHTIVRTRGRSQPIDVVPILNQLGAALDFAHQRQYIHRDIKPGNIMVGPDGKVTLLDFGLVRALMSDQHHTVIGTRMGTPAYMSPEQILGEPVTYSTDIYSLGHTVYEMLAGRAAFRGDEQAVYRAKLEATPPSIDGVPLEVQTVVMKALEKLPADRHRTAGEFAAAFRQAVETGEVVDPPPPNPRGLWWLIIGLLIALLAFGGIVGALTMVDGQPTPTPTPTMTPTTEASATIEPSATTEPSHTPEPTIAPTDVPPPVDTPAPPTRPPRPTDVPTAVPPTPVPPPTVAPVTIFFNVWCNPKCDLDDDTTCGSFNWRVEGAREVYLIGPDGGSAPSGGVGSIGNICLQPGERKQYTIRVLWMDGRNEEKSATFEREN